MIKKTSLLTAFSVTAFSGWAQDGSPDTLVVTANRFQQPVNTVLAPTDVVTREDIQRWQSKDLNDVMRRLPGVDIAQYGGIGQSSSLFVRGTEARHVLVLIDGVPMARAGIGNAIDIGQIPVSLVQRIEYIRGPRSAVYGSGAIGGVVNIITMSDDERAQINAGMGTNSYQNYDGAINQRFGDTMVTAAGAYQTTKGFNVQPDSTYADDSDRDGYRNKLFWGGVQHKFNDSVSGFFRGYGYSSNTDYDQGSGGYAGGGDESQNYTQSWDTGLNYHSGIYSSQLIANYQHLKNYNYNAQPATARPQAPAPQESLIHPLLMRNGDSRPLPKPTTLLPSLDLLTPPPAEVEPVDTFALEQMARLVEARLADFRIKADVVNYSPGPVITRFELNLAPGVKAARISNLSRDLARSLSTAAVRVVEVIPGKPYVGLELPNKKRQTVYLREVLDCVKFRESPSPLTVVLGNDIGGEPVIADLAKMPHLLVAGTTGSGKSVGVNAMILSMLYKAQPEDVKFIMIDPKMLELSVYEGIPHLLTEVVTDMKDAANALRWSVNEMERRYKLMSALGVRNLAGYNEKIAEAAKMGRPIPDPYWKPGDSMAIEHPVLEKLPYIVVLVDEFADLMMTVGKKVEELIARLAQKARAAGIHLVLATQRPSVDVITGLIKANIPTRIAFTVSSKIDSRTILDQGGAESLLGMGDMLYSGPNSTTPVRVHGAFVRDQEVHAVVQDWKARGRPQYVDGITSDSESEGGGGGFDGGEELDPLFDQAVNFVTEKRKASISGVQRQFRIGYNRAARIIEQMEAQGIVSEQGHNGNREVLAPPPFE